MFSLSAKGIKDVVPSIKAIYVEQVVGPELYCSGAVI